MMIPSHDARIFQILFLGLLLGIGVFVRDFSLQLSNIAWTFTAGLLTQWFFLRLLRLRNAGYLSPLITCLSLSLLLRSDRWWIHPLCAVIAMTSKFLIRFNGKHLFNPGNLGVIFALTFLPGSWASPGQWGNDLLLAGWIFVLGVAVASRAERSDISWSFLIFYASFLGLRVLWLGQRPHVWLHQLQNGALLLFTFFMISDPMTIPNHRHGRVIHAWVVALFAFVWQFVLFRTNGLLWGLLFASILVPIWDRIFPAQKYDWRMR